MSCPTKQPKGAATSVAAARAPDDVIRARDALYLQLAAFAGNEPEDSWLEIRSLNPWGAQEWIPVRELRQGVEAVVRLRNRHEVFVGVNPRTDRVGKAEHVARSWCLLADCDTPSAVERLRRFKPQPAIVVASGGPGRVHSYWPLRRPLENGAATAAKQALARALEADPKCVDPARVMRAIGSVNRKAEPAPVRCLRLEVEVFDAADVIGSLPAPPEPIRAPMRLIRPAGGALDAIPAAEYVPALTGRELGRDGKILCPFHEERTPSLHCYERPEDGWSCFGCSRGGSIVDFGAALYGIEPRGASFHEIRRRLAADLLGRAAA
jgi:hypothetical protein